MRYREGQVPDNIEPIIGQGPILLAVFIGLMIGIGFFIAGRRAGMPWMWIWGAGLAVCSVIYVGYVAFIQ